MNCRHVQKKEFSQQLKTCVTFDLRLEQCLFETFIWNITAEQLNAVLLE